MCLNLLKSSFFWFLAVLVSTAGATETLTTVPMMDKGLATFYVQGEITGVGPVDLLVDTGSGYVTINQSALDTLLSQDRAGYVKDLVGVLADGSELVVPIYSLESLRIGPECWLHDVHAAVFPGKPRFILGLSALQKAGSFYFDFDPPSLTLSRCETARG